MKLPLRITVYCYYKCPAQNYSLQHGLKLDCCIQIMAKIIKSVSFKIVNDLKQTQAQIIKKNHTEKD